MPLSDDQIDGLMRLLNLTRERELTCDECLSYVAEYVELELAGKPAATLLEAVRHHLELCQECHEEYLGLLAALKAGQA